MRLATRRWRQVGHQQNPTHPIGEFLDDENGQENMTTRTVPFTQSGHGRIRSTLMVGAVLLFSVACTTETPLVEIPPRIVDSEPTCDRSAIDTSADSRALDAGSVVAFYVCEHPLGAPLVPYGVEPQYSDVEQALRAIVYGSAPETFEQGLWTGFDRVPTSTRSALIVEVRSGDSFVGMRITGPDGEAFWPDSLQEGAGPIDWLEYSNPLRWTVFQDPTVERFAEPICFPLDDDDCEVTREDWEAVTSDRLGLPAGCGPVDIWTRDECQPAG